MQIILIKYGELSVKGDNRHIFISKLKKNITELVTTKMSIISKHDRIYIQTDEIPETVGQLKKIFGIQAIVCAEQIENEIEKMKKHVVKLIKKKSGATFKINTRRANKNFSLDSRELNHLLGGEILKNTNLKVDVKKPDILLTVEVRHDFTYLYTDTDEHQGLGGLPVSSSGRALLLLSGGLDSPIAGFLSLKRGVSLDCLYFESLPYTSIQARHKIIALVNVLNQYAGNIKLYIVNFTKIQEAIEKNIPHSYRITIMRRLMYQVASDFAHKNKYKGLITGENIGQVASQTLESLLAINEVTNMPIIRPLICYDKLETIALAKKIGSYEISTQPFIDCCTVFVPKKPATKPTIKKCLAYEKFLPDNLLDDIDIFPQTLEEEKHELL